MIKLAHTDFTRGRVVELLEDLMTVEVHRLFASAIGAYNSAGAPEQAGASPLMTALVAAVGTVLTALIAALASRRIKRRRAPAAEPAVSDDITTRFVAELVQRAERAEHRARRAEEHIDALEIELALARSSRPLMMLAKISDRDSGRDDRVVGQSTS